MTRTEIINGLINARKYHSYLEIGLQNAANNFDKINVHKKVSVDPDPNAFATFECTSDSFFSMNEVGKFESGQLTFDLIFIDGLHHADQVEKDIINAMKILNPGGCIVLHDCNPPEEWHQLVPRQHKVWYGDVWRAFVGLRETYDMLDAYCIDTDCGCGIIEHTSQSINPGFLSEISFKEFAANRRDYLNIVSVEEWL